jgi:hypothetical protein
VLLKPCKAVGRHFLFSTLGFTNPFQQNRSLLIAFIGLLPPTKTKQIYPSMKQVELRLIPAPGQKPEFLAIVELVHKQNVPDLWEHLPTVVVLEGYTRDAWASDTSTQWTTWQVESVDGRNKLPGFVKFLRDRQKTCFGRIVPSSCSDHHQPQQVWVI